MEHGALIYLDNGATSYPKPQAVYEAAWQAMTRQGGNPGRGSHQLSLAAAELVFTCRERAAAFFGVSEPERVFFTLNTTHGLNTVLKGLLHKGDHVLISDLEHNAVYRPLYKLAEEGEIELEQFPSMVGDPRRNGTRICAGIARRLKPNTKMVVSTHASNICSASMPIAQIGAFCHRHGLLFVVDGAQSAGHERIAVDAMNIDALCVPGHKGLYGPQGCGLVVLGKGILPESLTEGGNGVYSLEGRMPEFSPERYEAGTLPTPAIAGLGEGLRAVSEIGCDTIANHERALYRYARELLESIPELKLYAPGEEGAVLLFSMEGRPSEQIGAMLNEQGVCVRSGFHCAALAHRTLQTPADGAVRVSFGMFNRFSEVETLYRALSRLQKELPRGRE